MMEMFTEEELLPLSLIQHLLFCERRAALIQIECLWEDNLFTAEGSVLHHKVDEDITVESRGDVRITRGVLIRSLRLGLSGKADVVEFHRIENKGKGSAVCLANGIPLSGCSGLWRPYPVDYKRGRLRHEEGFEAQLCAQALCLEEMLGCAIQEGAIFYGKPHRRMNVIFNEALREKTMKAAARLHELIRSGKTPPARYEKKCESCSLIQLCLPEVAGTEKRVSRYLARAFAEGNKE